MNVHIDLRILWLIWFIKAMLVDCLLPYLNVTPDNFFLFIKTLFKISQTRSGERLNFSCSIEHHSATSVFKLMILLLDGSIFYVWNFIKNLRACCTVLQVIIHTSVVITIKNRGNLRSIQASYQITFWFRQNSRSQHCMTVWVNWSVL